MRYGLAVVIFLITFSQPHFLAAQSATTLKTVLWVNGATKPDFTIPLGANQITVEVRGGDGENDPIGPRYGIYGGTGHSITAIFAITNGETISPAFIPGGGGTGGSTQGGAGANISVGTSGWITAGGGGGSDMDTGGAPGNTFNGTVYTSYLSYNGYELLRSQTGGQGIGGYDNFYPYGVDDVNRGAKGGGYGGVGGTGGSWTYCAGGGGGWGGGASGYDNAMDTFRGAGGGGSGGAGYLSVTDGSAPDLASYTQGAILIKFQQASTGKKLTISARAIPKSDYRVWFTPSATVSVAVTLQ